MQLSHGFGIRWKGALLATLLLAGVALAEQQPDAAQAFQQGRWKEAAQAYGVLTVEDPQNGQAWYRLGYALHALGEYERALAAHEKAAGMQHAGSVTAAYNAACACSLLGRLDDAVAWLGKSVAAGFGSGQTLDTDADLAALRDDPRFWRIRNRVNDAGRFRSLPPAQPGDQRQFDFWIGEWDAESFAPNGKGGWRKANDLRIRVFPVAGGNALVEYSANPTVAAQGGLGMQGFSLRSYDPDRREWVSILNWPSKDKPLFYAMNGRFRHGRGQFVSPLSPAPGGAWAQSRFTFSDASESRFRWDSATTADGGKTWSTGLVFEGRRRAADASPLDVGPSKTHLNAAGPEFRGFDFLIGNWTGTRKTRGDGDVWAAEPVSARAYSILEGSAVVDHLQVGEGDGAYLRYSVRAFEPQRGKWVQYSIDNRSSRFDRFETVVGDGPIELAGVPGPGSAGAKGRIVWTERRAASLRSEGRDADETVWEQELRRVE